MIVLNCIHLKIVFYFKIITLKERGGKKFRNILFGQNKFNMVCILVKNELVATFSALSIILRYKIFYVTDIFLPTNTKEIQDIM